MTNDAVLPEPERTTFVQIMLNDTNDNSLVTAINAIVDQEAALIEMPAADIQAFKNGLQFAHKAGNIGTAYEFGRRLGQPAGQQWPRCPPVRLRPLPGRCDGQHPAQLRRPHS